MAFMDLAWWQEYRLYDKKTTFGALAKKCFAEFIGTAFLVFFGSAIGASLFHSLHVLQDAQIQDLTADLTQQPASVPSSAFFANEPINILFIATGFAAAVFVAISIASNISGGHVNPAITVASFLSKKISLVTGLLYIVSQLLGGTFGCWIVAIVDEPAFLAAKGSINSINRTAEIGKANILVLEAAIGFTLALVVLVLSTKFSNTPANPMMVPTAAALVIFVGHLIAVPVDGFVGNPVRAFSPALVTHHWADQWIFWVGPLIGAILAAFVYLIAFADFQQKDGKWYKETILPVTTSDLPSSERKSEAPLQSIKIQTDEAQRKEKQDVAKDLGFPGQSNPLRKVTKATSSQGSQKSSPSARKNPGKIRRDTGSSEDEKKSEELHNASNELRQVYGELKNVTDDLARKMVNLETSEKLQRTNTPKNAAKTGRMQKPNKVQRFETLGQKSLPKKFSFSGNAELYSSDEELIRMTDGLVQNPHNESSKSDIPKTHQTQDSRTEIPLNTTEQIFDRTLKVPEGPYAGKTESGSGSKKDNNPHKASESKVSYERAKYDPIGNMKKIAQHNQKASVSVPPLKLPVQRG